MASISAIVPTFNRAHLIEEAITSILAQSRPVTEVIVVDDGSTDDTEAAVRKFGRSVRFVRQDNRGPGAARNTGVRIAQGDYLAFLDSDDLWVEDKIERQMEFFEKNPDVDLVFGLMSNFRTNEEAVLPEVKNAEIYGYLKAHSSRLDAILECLLVENFIPTPTVTIRARCMGEVGFFDETLSICEDLDYWLRAARTQVFGFIDQVLAKRRRHEGNLIGDWLNVNLCLLEVLGRVERWGAELTPTRKERLSQKLFRTRYDVGSHLLKKGDFAAAYKLFSASVPPTGRDHKWRTKLMLCYLLQRFTKPTQFSR